MSIQILLGNGHSETLFSGVSYVYVHTYQVVCFSDAILSGIQRHMINVVWRMANG